nr:MAG TPA: hypothetical protein [Caudoviricetes sp.]
MRAIVIAHLLPTIQLRYKPLKRLRRTDERRLLPYA